MRAVVTVIGEDRVGIIAKVSGYLADNSVNIIDISQTIMKDMFCMIMLIEYNDDKTNIKKLSNELSTLGDELGLSIRLQREELFHSMHRI